MPGFPAPAPPRPRALAAAVAAVALVLACAQPAEAYVDPGSGSYVLQLLLAGLLGASYAVRLQWQRLRRLLGRFLPGGSGDRSRDGDA